MPLNSWLAAEGAGFGENGCTSIGFEAPAACHDRINRAPLAETVTFVDG